MKIRPLPSASHPHAFSPSPPLPHYVLHGWCKNQPHLFLVGSVHLVTQGERAGYLRTDDLRLWVLDLLCRNILDCPEAQMEGGDDGGFIRDAMSEILIGRTVPVAVEDPDSGPIVDNQIPPTARILRRGQLFGVLLVAIVAAAAAPSREVNPEVTSAWGRRSESLVLDRSQCFSQSGLSQRGAPTGSRLRGLFMMRLSSAFPTRCLDPGQVSASIVPNA